jgi:ATP-dependent helicase Lhr and Lhr-like helicase
MSKTVKSKQERRNSGTLPRALQGFQPSVAKWFTRTFDAPSPAQKKAWPAIRRGDNTLLLAPTGSGKTLAAFMCAIDGLFKQGLEGELQDGIQVLYISPLKALGNDIHKNLMQPLEGICKATHKKLPEIRIAVRTGDTPQSERQKMIRKPPHILITTPESLFLLLASKKMAPHLATVKTVIVDEVHALCDNKRGVHLALSLERLLQRVEKPFQRVGCSATLSPLDEIAKFLVGFDPAAKPNPYTIVDAGMRKNLDVKVVAPLPDFLAASNTAMWASAYELLINEIKDHETTLVFCNSRYKAERASLRMKEIADKDIHLGVHHGSMAKDMRLEAEHDLKQGNLDALVATSSLELGIDVGSVDLVYQLESSKSVAAGLQRIGRAGHLLDATSKGRVLVFERDELLEAAVICRAMLKGNIDAIRIPRNCLDVLAQQIVGAVAAEDWQDDALFQLIRRSYPYSALKREEFDAVLRMLAGEFSFDMSHAPRALVIWDRATGKLSPTRSCAHTSVMNVGTISESSEYEVIIEKTNKRIGKVSAEFVDDSLRIGDVFVFGSSTWKVLGKRKNRVTVEETPGATPTVPWWTGPIQARTTEVGREVGKLRSFIAQRIDDPRLLKDLQKQYCLGPDAAGAVIDYIREQLKASSLVPDHENFLIELWKDELGRFNIIIHCPLGWRINHTWGGALALAAKKKFKQEWTVSTSNDLIILSLSSKGNFPGCKIDAKAILNLITPASLDAMARQDADKAMFGDTHFRQAAVTALQIVRAYKGKRIPLWLQIHRAQELFEAAKQDPDYPIFKEVRRNYLEQALDVRELKNLLQAIKHKKTKLIFKTVTSPSPFAHSLLITTQYRTDHQMGRERRAHLLRLHQEVLKEVLSTKQLAQLLDRRAIEKLEKRVSYQSEAYQARNRDELAQIIRNLGDICATRPAVEALAGEKGMQFIKALVREKRVVATQIPNTDHDNLRLVVSDQWRLYHDAFTPKTSGRLKLLMPVISRQNEFGKPRAVNAADVIPPRFRKKMPRAAAQEAIAERYLKTHGPISLYELMDCYGWPAGTAEKALTAAVNTGKAHKGTYTGDKPQPQWVNKANLEEIHRSTMGYLKRELAACAPYEVVDFMIRWQHRHPEHRVKGLDGLRQVIGQLQGYEVLQGVLEPEILRQRVEDYSPALLDKLIASGEVVWRRVSSKRLCRGFLTLALRKDMDWLAQGDKLKFDPVAEADEDIPEVIATVREYMRKHQSAFFDEILSATHLDEGPAQRALWYLAWTGEVTCDSYECLRHANFTVALSACYDLASTPQTILLGRVSPDSVLKHMHERRLDPRQGRWWATERLVPPSKALPREDVIRKWADLLLTRWGIVSKAIVKTEVAAPPWAELMREFKRRELLGDINRGHFIESHAGVQYGLPEAIELLRNCRARRSDGQALGYLPDEAVFAITNKDPANLYFSCLDVLDERGEVFRSRQGNYICPQLVQAGQVLLFWNSHLLAKLKRKQLSKCLAALRDLGTALNSSVDFLLWNGHPIDVHPVAGFLYEQGFRFNSQGRMCWPPRGKKGKTPEPCTYKEFLPYYEEPDPVEYNSDWVLSRAAPLIQPKLAELLQFLEAKLTDEQRLIFDQSGFRVTYRGEKFIWPYLQKKQLCLFITHKAWAPHIIVTPDTDLNGRAFKDEFKHQTTQTMEAIDAYLAKRKRGQKD